MFLKYQNLYKFNFLLFNIADFLNCNEFYSKTRYFCQIKKSDNFEKN